MSVRISLGTKKKNYQPYLAVMAIDFSRNRHNLSSQVRAPFELRTDTVDRKHDRAREISVAEKSRNCM